MPDLKHNAARVARVFLTVEVTGERESALRYIEQLKGVVQDHSRFVGALWRIGNEERELQGKELKKGLKVEVHDICIDEGSGQ